MMYLLYKGNLYAQNKNSIQTMIIKFHLLLYMNNYNLINKYLIAGHSSIDVNNYREMRLPPNVWLVMHSACGQTFNKNRNFHNILHNQNKLKD